MALKSSFSLIVLSSTKNRCQVLSTRWNQSNFNYPYYRDDLANYNYPYHSDLYYPLPVTFEHVVFPPNGQMHLPEMPSEPFYDPALGEQKYKTAKRITEGRGYEPIHTDLIHQQYGLRALTGGFIEAADFAFIRDRINRNLREKQFAIWRVDAPWLPRTKKAQGTKLGGGKGSIKNYVTPVRAGRILFELGGHIIEPEARAYITYLSHRFAFPVEFVSYELLERKKAFEENVRIYNQNKFDWDVVLKYNMQNCYSFVSKYDYLWGCKYK